MTTPLRPLFQTLLLALPLLGWLVSDVNAADQAGKKPNIVFIMSDDHAFQAISAYPGAINKTPNIDRIAKEGMRFDHCYVTNSICGPARAVILTGKFSHLNGFYDNKTPKFDGSQMTYPKLLQKAGYQTAVIGKWHLGTEPTGFDYFNVLRGQGPYYNPQMRTSDGPKKYEGHTSEIITDLALNWLDEKRDPNKPFLLVYQHKAPHRNWMPAPKYLDKYNDVEFAEPETMWDDYSNRASGAKNQDMTISKTMTPHDLKLAPQRGLTPAQKKVWDAAYGPKNKAFEDAQLEGKDLVRWKFQRYIKDYLRCIDSVDEGVGKVLDYLDDNDLTDNTMVIYTSDQGFYLGEHGWFDKRWMYEESFRTPLMVRWPGHIKPGTVSESLVMNLDFPETMLAAAGVDIPEDMQGLNILPILEGDGTTPQDWPRDALYYHYYEFPGAHSVPRHYGVFDGRYKLINYYQLGEWELFDLQEDPNEMNSVYGKPDYAEVQTKMHEKLKELRKQYQDDTPRENGKY
ncbi:sulfatase family protein [Bremerella sp. T1]|uniref:sulfatase family protein n=1 Tax=Bremerella sp. TYQ1 TaxID=3119568 RepID=UPI001CCF72C0|nr:sulfatase [Bremerella volcania]UBM34288.1 sulfatase [Bremerella volcania]